MPIYDQTPIRLQVTLVGNPPVYPIDQLTGVAPKFWRTSNVAIQVGIFDALGAPVNLTNLAKLQLMLFKSPTDLVPLFTKEIASGANLYPQITQAGWQDGTQQNGTFVLSLADTDQALGGLKQADFWVVLNGIPTGGGLVLYAAGPLTIFLASSAIPVSVAVTPSEEEIVNNAGPVVVTPTSNIHLAVITVGGTARTSNVVIGQAGLTKGARVKVLVLAPGAVGGIILQFFIGSLIGENPFAWSTDGGTTRYSCEFYFGADGLLHPLEQVNPAF